ncbi:uncharacterized protein LOC62_02G003429 [Vanrija pseudolonga]|uniref:Extracellular membrane protein CFEM domain-containing protein n=1 Tax=Vanrija pseudolonga TaxID=143232 RepID=A0AAF0Y4H5_9TREE|nr:hypothetical protein LOC62_02G003429 [Vanrija pseudolonga]
MLVKSLLALTAVSVAAAQNSSSPLLQAIGAIPASCNTPCTTYKGIFENCPTNNQAPECAQACNGTVLLELQSCINCTLIDGPPLGVTTTTIDLLNLAQQYLAQQCIDGGFPATFTGQVVAPTAVPLPPGVSSTPLPSSSAAPTTAASGSASGASGASGAAASPSASNKPSSAGALAAPGAVLSAAVLAGVLAVL